MNGESESSSSPLRQPGFVAVAVACMLVGACPGLAGVRPVILADGHSEFHFTLENDSQLRLSVWDADAQRVLAPGDTIMQVVTAAKRPFPEGFAPPLERWVPLGAATGGSVWVIPQTQQSGILWFGTRAVIDSSLLRPLAGPDFGPGQLSLHLISVTGSGPDAGGHFSLYTTDAFGSPTFRFRTDNGIGEDDVIAPINAQSHTHYNWAFTEPGDYGITVEARATLRSTGEAISARETFHFQVLEPVPTGNPAPRLHAHAEEMALRWTAIPGERYTIWRSTDLRRWTIERVVTADAVQMEVLVPEDASAAFFRIPSDGN